MIDEKVMYSDYVKNYGLYAQSHGEEGKELFTKFIQWHFDHLSQEELYSFMDENFGFITSYVTDKALDYQIYTILLKAFVN